ncbi:hypothetical protein [Novosphingobium rosa]|uniref:hypothetical protein n=1 Tax=Novosphingobium rosa TaxID=76978 RepID=UPI00083493AF|nr:hypothetical protein [Novosphingobium rosa]
MRARKRLAESISDDCVAKGMAGAAPHACGPTLGGLTCTESHALAISADLWNAYLKLPVLHPDETSEFRHKLHELQRIIMARPTLEAMTLERKTGKAGQ